MIKVVIKTDGETILDEFNNEDCTIAETALVIYRLEQLKLLLLAKEFDSDFIVERG